MNAKKCKKLRRMFPDWRNKEFIDIKNHKVVPNPNKLIGGFMQVTMVTKRLKPDTDSSHYRRGKRFLK